MIIIFCYLAFTCYKKKEIRENSRSLIVNSSSHRNSKWVQMGKIILTYNDMKVKMAIEKPSLSSNFTLGDMFRFEKVAYENLKNPYSEEKKELGKRLCLARHAVGFSQNMLSDLIDTSRKQIINIEKGKADPSIKTLYDIFYRLKINPKILFISKDDLDYYARQLGTDISKHIQFDEDDFNIITNAFESFELTELKTAFKRCKRYFEMVFTKHSTFNDYEWAAKVGAIIGLYVGRDMKYFDVGAFLSVKLFKDLYE